MQIDMWEVSSKSNVNNNPPQQSTRSRLASDESNSKHSGSTALSHSLSTVSGFLAEELAGRNEIENTSIASVELRGEQDMPLEDASVIDDEPPQ